MLTDDDHVEILNEINRLYDTSQAELDELNRYLVQPVLDRRPPSAERLRGWAAEKARFEAWVDVLGKAAYHLNADGFEVGLARVTSRVIASYPPDDPARKDAFAALEQVCLTVSQRVPA